MGLGSLDSMDSLWGFVPDEVIGGVDIDGSGGFAGMSMGMGGGTGTGTGAGAGAGTAIGIGTGTGSMSMGGVGIDTTAAGAGTAGDMFLGEHSLGAGAAAGFGFDVARHVIHVDLEGRPHPTCAWVKFSGPLVRDVLRMGAPAAIVFRAGAGEGGGGGGGGESKHGGMAWVEEASQFSVSNAASAHGLPEAAELTVCLPHFPLAVLASLAGPSGALCAGLWVVPKSQATSGAGDGGPGGAGWGGGGGGGAHEDAVQLAVLELQPLEPPTPPA